jgi:hypothetical protein
MPHTNDCQKCDANLSASKRAVFTARCKVAHEALHPEIRSEAFKGNQHFARSQVGNEQATFATDQAAKTGQSERANERGDVGRSETRPFSRG